MTTGNQTALSSGQTPCNSTCPVQRTAQILDGKWTTLIVRDLLSGKKRYSELQRSLAGISPRLLAARLRLLERNGMLTRRVFATVPPTTEYELTPTGRGLGEVIRAMATFGTEWAQTTDIRPGATAHALAQGEK